MQSEDQLFQIMLENLNARNQMRVNQFNILAAVGMSRALAYPNAGHAKAAPQKPKNMAVPSKKRKEVSAPNVTSAVTTANKNTDKKAVIVAEDLLAHSPTDNSAITKVSMTTSGQEAARNGQ